MNRAKHLEAVIAFVDNLYLSIGKNQILMLYNFILDIRPMCIEISVISIAKLDW